MIWSADKIFTMVGLVWTLTITSLAITDGYDQFTQAPILHSVLTWLGHYRNISREPSL